MKSRHLTGIAAASATLLLAACGGSNTSVVEPAPRPIPQLSEATGAKLAACADLAGKLDYPDTTITAINDIPAGTLTVAGKDVPQHCQVTGRMLPRTSTVNGKDYAIGFELRLPLNWNGRFFYQANGGIDGNVATATGGIGGGGSLNNALNMGFAVISSDAGYTGMGPEFGIDPQARLDYGYQAVGKLTPMAKTLIKTAYGKEPDRSYIGGCSNGGRHTMVAASRYADLYDGFLAGNPGYRLPLAAVANIAGAQTYAKLATNPADISTGFSLDERRLVANAVLDKCDALDGVADGMINDTTACQAAFDLETAVPTCAGARDGTCLSADQKTEIAKLFRGATTESGKKIYTSFPYDAGITGNDWSFWKFMVPVFMDSGAVAMIWQTPPEDPATFNPATFALTGSLDSMLSKIGATDAVYTESALDFMIAPNASDLSTLKYRGAKMMVYHGTSDGIFSSDDSAQWYDDLRANHGGDASNFARYFQVPGMNHCAGGPSADQFDMLTPLVNWVEKGQAPDFVVASARGAGNPGGVNAEVPASWSATRTRPLCPYPKVAVYNGSGNIEDAVNFSCK